MNPSLLESRLPLFVALERGHSYPRPCPSQFVEHLPITNGYSMKFV